MAEREPLTQDELDTLLFITNQDDRLTLWFYDNLIKPYILIPFVIPFIERLTKLIAWLNDLTQSNP